MDLKTLDWLLMRTHEMRETCFDEFKEQAKKGIPYKERLAAIENHKLEWCDKEIIRLTAERKELIKPAWQIEKEKRVKIAAYEQMWSDAFKEIDRAVTANFAERHLTA